MAASKFALICTSNLDQKSTLDLMGPTPSAGSTAGGAADAWSYIREVSDFFGSAAVGSVNLNLIYTDGLAYASATVTWGGNLSNNDNIIIGGTTLTFVTGTPTAHQIKIGASQAATKLSFENYVNTNADFLGMVTAIATSSSVSTLQAAYPGLIGNAIVVTKTAANLTVVSPLAGGLTSSYSAPVSAGQ